MNFEKKETFKKIMISKIRKFEFYKSFLKLNGLKRQ